MKKQLTILASCVLMGVLLASCSGFGGDKPTINIQYIYGTWQKVGTQEYRQFFTAEQDTVFGNECYGREWNEGEDVYPSDLVYHGNGWFRWHIDGVTLYETEHLDEGWAEVPKIYTLTQLDSTKMVYQDSYKVTQTFVKTANRK